MENLSLCALRVFEQKGEIRFKNKYYGFKSKIV